MVKRSSRYVAYRVLIPLPPVDSLLPWKYLPVSMIACSIHLKNYWSPLGPLQELGWGLRVNGYKCQVGSGGVVGGTQAWRNRKGATRVSLCLLYTGLFLLPHGLSTKCQVVAHLEL